jgi:hypothetical protein
MKRISTALRGFGLRFASGMGQWLRLSTVDFIVSEDDFGENVLRCTGEHLFNIIH